MAIQSAKLDKGEVVQAYTNIAPVYDLWGHLGETKARKRSLELAMITNGEKILEVAVGTGLTFEEIVRANPDGENVGVDLTPAMLAKARARLEQSGLASYTLFEGDAYNLDFPDNTFDLLVNNYMFDLMPEKDFTLLLQEFRRVLKPTGRIVLVNMTKGDRIFEQIWETVYRINPRWLGGCRGVLLAESLESCGFKNIHRENLTQFWFPSEIITADI